MTSLTVAHELVSRPLMQSRVFSIRGGDSVCAGYILCWVAAAGDFGGGEPETREGRPR